MINYLKPLLFKVSDFTYKINKLFPRKGIELFCILTGDLEIILEHSITI